MRTLTAHYDAAEKCLMVGNGDSWFTVPLWAAPMLGIPHKWRLDDWFEIELVAQVKVSDPLEKMHLTTLRCRKRREDEK